MANKSISQYSENTAPARTDKYLLQVGNEYRSIQHINMMMGIQRVVLSLTTAQIDALNATPIEIVGADGSGTVIVPLQCSAYNSFSGAAFAGAGTKIILKHSGQSNLLMETSTSFVPTASNLYEELRPVTLGATNQKLFANTGLVVATNGDITIVGASGTITLDLLYVIKRFA